MARRRIRLRVRGTVQGVGFRPFVHGLATGLGLAGFVTNTADGVTIEVEGERIAEFLCAMESGLPPLARVISVESEEIPPIAEREFTIRASVDAGGFTLISPDVCTCDDCLSEMRDPSDSRHGYAFINCTNCGPRYSITLRTPYDRPNTTMARFTMCQACLAEYEDPSNRRFHAVPNACPACGPRVSLVMNGARVAADGDAIGDTIRMIREGRVVAVKGLGGFHLACDALSAEAVARLRRVKRMGGMKPFALMARDMDVIMRYCDVSENEERLLTSHRRPVVLLRKGMGCCLPEDIAPGMRELGFMLPYTPLHHLLMDELGVAVMTSGNLSEEPIQVDNAAAETGLGSMADAFLMHDRDIYMRVDDSVIRSAGLGGPSIIRRSRGYAPEAIGLLHEGPDVMGAGADLKNTFAILKGASAIVSQHIGDMENIETLAFYEETLRNLKAVYRAEPVAIAHDMHPGYMSAQWALRQPGAKLAVQHHHAHIASVMAEHGLGGAVIGVALDGTGYGPDGSIWGGEFMICTPLEYKRTGRFEPIALPGGERAIKEPWRTAAALVASLYGNEADRTLDVLGFHERYGRGRLAEVMKVARMREFSPLSSGAGRLFDAVSAIIGLCGVNTFEAEAAMRLESAVDLDEEAHYPFDMRITSEGLLEVDFAFTLLGLVSDRLSGAPVSAISARFHRSVAEAVCRLVGKISASSGIMDVALSGGVFQNITLLGAVVEGLSARSLRVWTNRAVPTNDAGVSLGQAFILRERIKAGLFNI